MVRQSDAGSTCWAERNGTVLYLTQPDLSAGAGGVAEKEGAVFCGFLHDFLQFDGKEL